MQDVANGILKETLASTLKEYKYTSLWIISHKSVSHLLWELAENFPS